MDDRDYHAFANKFADIWDVVAEDIHRNAVAKGFYEEGAARNKGELLMLIVSELAETLEEVRKPTEEISDKTPQFTKTEEEMADAVIRIMDTGYAWNLRLPDAILAKMRYNKTRPYKHGKKF